MLKRITIILFGFIAGVLGNLIAAWVQQDLWSNVFTQERLLVTAGSILLMLMLVASLETERALVWNWRWHRFWYLRELLQNSELRHWESDFARLEMVQGKRARILSAEVLAEGNRKDMIEVVRGLIKDRDGKSSRALILGEPGAGKTTGIERLTLDLARAAKRRLGIGCKIPVLVRLGTFQEGKLIDHIAQTMRHSAKNSSGKILSKGIDMLLEKGRVVLLCDALDEALGARRDLVIAELKNLLTSQAYQNVPIIITSRTREDPGEALKGLTICEIQDLNDEAVNTFIRAYKQPDHSEAEILQRLHAHRLLEPGGLGRNPFWLRLIVSSGAFEGNKGQILNDAVDTLLAREWDEKPRVERSWQRVLPKEEQLHETKYALAWLGYWMSTSNQTALDSDQARTELERCLKSRKQVSVKSLRSQDILGLGRDAQLLAYQPNPIRFRHRLLQEFMTAWMLKENFSLLEQALKRCGHDIQEWPTLLMFGDLVDDRESFIRQVLGDESSLERVLLAFELLEQDVKISRKKRLLNELNKNAEELNDVPKSLLPFSECTEKWRALLFRSISYRNIEWQISSAFASFLVAGLSGQQVHLCKKAIHVFGEKILDRFALLLLVDNDAVRMKVIELLKELGSPKATEYLVMALGDENLRDTAKQTLVQIGAPAIQPLILALRWTNPSERIKIDTTDLEESRHRARRSIAKWAKSIEKLEVIGDNKTIRAARKQFQDFELNERRNRLIMQKMQGLQQEFPDLEHLKKQMTQSLVQAFEDAGLPEAAQIMDSCVKIEEWLMSRLPEPQAVIDTLLQIGEPVVDALIETMNLKCFGDVPGAQSAVEALRRIASPKAIDALISKLNSDNLMGYDVLLADTATKSLIAIGEPAIPALLTALYSDTMGKKLQVYEILRAMGQPVIAPLLELLRNGSDFSVPGLGLLSEIAENPENIDTLVAALRNDYGNFTFAVYYVLNEIGEAAIDKLITALGEKESSWAIVRLLADIGIPTIKPLTKALSHDNPNLRLGAAQALDAIAMHYPINDTTTLQQLARVMRNDDTNAKYYASSALALVGASAIDYVNPLLDDKDAGIRLSAVLCFLKMGLSNTVNLTEPLLKVLKDPNSEVRYWAIAALGQTGDKHALIPLFNKLLAKPDIPRPTRADVLKSLVRIAFRPILDLKMAKSRRFRSRLKDFNAKAASSSLPKR